MDYLGHQGMGLAAHLPPIPCVIFGVAMCSENRIFKFLANTDDLKKWLYSLGFDDVSIWGTDMGDFSVMADHELDEQPKDRRFEPERICDFYIDYGDFVVWNGKEITTCCSMCSPEEHKVLEAKWKNLENICT